jgi:hypothetical protein
MTTQSDWRKDLQVNPIEQHGKHSRAIGGVKFGILCSCFCLLFKFLLG